MGARIRMARNAEYPSNELEKRQGLSQEDPRGHPPGGGIRDAPHHAGAAIDRTGEEGSNDGQFLERGLNGHAIVGHFIETHLQQALEKQQFVLHYQPKVNLETGAITCAETLLRWVHPEWGTILPAGFLPIAEDFDLVAPIGDHLPARCRLVPGGRGNAR